MPVWRHRHIHLSEASEPCQSFRLLWKRHLNTTCCHLLQLIQFELHRITMSSMLLSWVYLLCIFSMWCAAHICITTIGATWLQYLFQPILNKRSERQTWNHQQKKAVETHNIFDWWVLARHVPTTDQHGSTKSKAETHHHPSPHHPLLPANNQTWRPQQNRFVFQTSSIEQYICYPSVILIKHGNEESWRIPQVW